MYILISSFIFQLANSSSILQVKEAFERKSKFNQLSYNTEPDTLYMLPNTKAIVEIHSKYIIYSLQD